MRSRFLLPLVAASACAGEPLEDLDVHDEDQPPRACEGKCDGAAWTEALGALPEGPVATLFAPYEPALGLDLALIAEVTRARVADGRLFAEGDNPFSIRYAVYNLDNPAIAEALAAAEGAGVDVQILIEADQLDPARPWNETDELLEARGFEIVRDHRALTPEQHRTADLVGIESAGHMHLKARLFAWIDPATGLSAKRLVTGSMNPGDLAVYNDETLHLVTIPEVIARYEDVFTRVREGRRPANRLEPGAAVQALFCPADGPQAVDEIARLVDREEELILLTVFTLRNVKPRSGGPGILERLVAAHQRGVTVIVVTDRKQSDGVDAWGNDLPDRGDDPDEDILRHGGVPVFEVLNNATSPFNAMHDKVGIFGLTRPVVVTDTANWTRAGLGSGTRPPENVESVLVLDTIALDGGRTARRYLGHFLAVVRRYGLDAGPTFDRLAALPGWPDAETIFRARVETRLGEAVAATGDLPELGGWSAQGWPLATDAASYPIWTSAPLTLPFGAETEYKLIKVEGGRIEWEAGGNRRLVNDPTAHRAGDVLEWRQ